MPINLRTDAEVENFITETLNQQKAHLLSSIKDLLDAGLLVAKVEKPRLMIDSYSKKVRVEPFITLEVKEQEVIDKLKAENDLLKEKLAAIKEVMNDEA